jgi:hypothetical protein
LFDASTSRVRESDRTILADTFVFLVHPQFAVWVLDAGKSRRLRFDGFVGLTLASPGIEHVAWIPWFSGFPFAGNRTGEVNGDVLSIDDHRVWVSSDKNAAVIWDVAWQSDTTLTFCGRTWKHRASRFRAVIAGSAIRVARIGGVCPPDDHRQSTGGS